MSFNIMLDVIPTPIEILNILGCGGIRQGTIMECWGNPKCLTGETIVIVWKDGDEYGIGMKIEDLTADKIDCAFRVMAYDVESGESVLTEASPSFQSGVAEETLRIHFADGGVLVCTPEHLILTENRGYVPACELTLDDLVQETKYPLSEEKAQSGNGEKVRCQGFVSTQNYTMSDAGPACANVQFRWLGPEENDYDMEIKFRMNHLPADPRGKEFDKAPYLDMFNRFLKDLNRAYSDNNSFFKRADNENNED